MLRSPLICLLPLTLVLVGCGGTSHADLMPQPVAGLPSHFVGSAGASEQATVSCRSPLRDLDGAVVLTLVRSGRDRARPGVGWGDYAVSPTGSYGMRLDQLLRLECGSGVPAGVVRK